MNRALVWRTIQNSTWLIGGLVMLGIAFFLWIGIQIHDHIVVEKPLDMDVPIEPEKVRFSPTLGMMTDIVPVLDLSKSSTESIHTAEFRGADYIKSQNNRWFLHVMTVTKIEVIKSYLASRADRTQFTYFRYIESKQPVRYVLAYGSFAAVNQALDASKTVQFDLPDSVKVYPQRFSELKKFVSDEVTADEKISNLGGANQLYQVKLRSVPVPVEQPTPSSRPTTQPTESFSDSTTQPVVVNPLGTTTANPTQATSGAINTGTNQPQLSSGQAIVNPTVSANNSAKQPLASKPSTGSLSTGTRPANSNPANSSTSGSANTNSTNNNPVVSPNQSGATVEAPRPIADPFN